MERLHTDNVDAQNERHSLLLQLNAQVFGRNLIRPTKTGAMFENDRGREVRLSRTPLPPNRACGSPAHGSPVSGCPVIGIERNGYGRLADFETPDP